MTADAADAAGFDPVRQIHLLGRELFSACCIGDPPPATQRMFDRMRRPQVGDLVIEVSSFSGYDPDGVGWLREIEPHPDHPDDPELVERYVVEPLGRPRVEQGWRNARFVAVPTERASAWLGEQVAPASR